MTGEMPDGAISMASSARPEWIKPEIDVLNASVAEFGFPNRPEGGFEGS